LVSLVTDAVILMHPNRTAIGKLALRPDFLRSFEQFTVDQTVISNETLVARA
jgi:hypothetical protein